MSNGDSVPLVEKIMEEQKLLAIVVSHRFNAEGIHFFTSNDLSQQLAYMRHPTGRVIQPHVHNPVRREVHYTQEVLFIKRGKLRVDFYSESAPISPAGCSKPATSFSSQRAAMASRCSKRSR